MTSIGLGMMVKNEAAIITRALASAAPLVDYVLVIDTGSTDGTQDVVRSWLDDPPRAGQLIESDWVDFGHNRSLVLAEMRKANGGDGYCLMLDADEIVDCPDPAAVKRQLTADVYDLDMRRGPLVYQLPRLTANIKPFYYKGPAHEWIACDEPHEHAPLGGLALRALGAGARTRDPERYRREAGLFETLLKDPALPAFERQRYGFYLAQSYRDCGEPWAALRAYEKRAEMGGWGEEVYLSLLNAARLRERLAHNSTQPTAAILALYKKAITLNPQRAEAMHGAAKLCREAGLHCEGYALAKMGVRLPLYRGLFVETWIYQYGLLDEFAICAYWAGERLTSWLACEILLRGELDPATRERVEKNASYARGGNT